MAESTINFFIYENLFLTILFVIALKKTRKLEYNKFFLTYIILTIALEYLGIKRIRFYYLAQLIPAILLFSTTNLKLDKSKTFILAGFAFTLLALYQFVYVYYYVPIASGDIEIRDGLVKFIEENTFPGDMIMGYTTFVSEVGMRTSINVPPWSLNTFFSARQSAGTSPQEFIKDMKRYRVKFFLDRTDSYSLLGLWPELGTFVVQNCEPYIKFPHPRGDIAVWKCKT